MGEKKYNLHTYHIVLGIQGVSITTQVKNVQLLYNLYNKWANYSRNQLKSKNKQNRTILKRTVRICIVNSKYEKQRRNNGWSTLIL